MTGIVRRPTLVAVFACACLVAAHQDAHAESTGIVVVTGNLAAQERSTIESAIIVAVRQAKWLLSAQPFSPKEIEVIKACLGDDRPWHCLNPLMQPKGVDRIILAEAKSPPDAPAKLVLTGEFVVAGNGTRIVAQQRCDRCDAAGLTAAARRLTEELLQDMATLNEQTIVDIQTVPAGASVTLDEHAIGTTNPTGISQSTYPGPHRLTTQLTGYVRDERTIDVAAGKTTKIVVHLTPERAGTPGRPRLVPGIVAGAGLVAVIGGSWVSATAEDSPTGKTQKYVYSAPGLGVAAAGVVAIGVAVYLWRRSPRTPSAPTVSLLPGGGAVGWATSF
jgi:hypothetical protein